MTMSRRISAILVLTALAAPTLRAQDAGAEEQPKPAELFRDACSHCHIPPDPQQPTDRAWITQLLDTA